MSYVDHNAGEINAKVLWCEDGPADFEALAGRLWRLRAKWKHDTLELDEGEVSVLSLRLPPYRKFHGYHVRFHLYGPSPELLDDPALLGGTDAVVISADGVRPPVLEGGVIVVERRAGQTSLEIARVVGEAIHAALEAGEGAVGSPGEGAGGVAGEKMAEVGAFTFAVNLEGLEPEVDDTAVRSRMLLSTPNGYDLVVLVYPNTTAQTSDVFVDAEQTWGTPEYSDGPELAGFTFERAVFGATEATASAEVLACRMRENLLVATFIEQQDAEAVPELRRYFLAMIESAILRSPENSP